MWDNAHKFDFEFPQKYLNKNNAECPRPYATNCSQGTCELGDKK